MLENEPKHVWLCGPRCHDHHDHPHHCLTVEGATIDLSCEICPGVYRLNVKTDCGCYSMWVNVPCPPAAIHKEEEASRDKGAVIECCEE